MARDSEQERPEGTLSLEALVELFGRNARLVVATLGAAIVASIVVVAAREPVYRAKASLILDDASATGGVLGELAMLGKAPAAASQIEILRARSTAEETVARPANDAEDERARHLGLTTIVGDSAFHPLNELASSSEPEGKLPPRLRAEFACADEFDELREVEVEFLDATTVRISGGGLLSGPGAIEAKLDGSPIPFGGCELRLWPEGDLGGRSFDLERLTRDEAIERVMLATRVRETERNSGVIEVSFDDSDPRRAAETANALCRNYLARSESRGDRRVSSTVEFIRDSLAKQTQALRDAEAEVVRVQRANPRAINVTKSGEMLIEQLSELEVQRMRADLARVSTGQAIELLAAGDDDALSRLSVELDDPVTAAYLQSLAKLAAEHALQERSDAGPYRLLLQQHESELRGQLDVTELELGSLTSLAAAIREHDSTAVARLGGGPPSARDPLLEGYLATLGQLQDRASELERETTEKHPARIETAQRIEATIARIGELLDARIEGLRGQAEAQRALLAHYAERNEHYPVEERARIQSAIASLRERTSKHLASRLGGLERTRQSLADEIRAVERSLGDLPEEERVVAEPVRKLTAHAEIVKLLLAKEQEAQITQAATVAGAEFIDVAVPPLERSTPSLPLHLLLGILAGTAAAIGLALAKEALVRGIFTSAELEMATGLSVLGAIPDFRRGRYKVRGAREFFVPLRDDPEGATAEAYRSLRANLKFAFAAGREVRAIAATSCTEGEGKSSTNVALAMSFARSGRRVVLVNCDMRRPSIEKYLGLERTPGLSDVLARKTSWREVVRKDVVEHLDVLTAGAQPRSPGDLLDSQAFTELLAELESEYDLVVCDVPPAIAVSDIESCAARLDALILVVRTSKASAHHVERTTQRLRQTGANLIGAVLLGVGNTLANGKYGYGYGYGDVVGERERDAG